MDQGFPLVDELVLHYQVQASVRTGDIIGVESLVRWLLKFVGMTVAKTLMGGDEVVSILRRKAQ